MVLLVLDTEREKKCLTRSHNKAYYLVLSKLHKFYCRHYKPVDCREISISQMAIDLFTFNVDFSPTRLILNLTMNNTVGILQETGPAYPLWVHGFTHGFLVGFRIGHLLTFLCWVFFVICFHSVSFV